MKKYVYLPYTYVQSLLNRGHHRSVNAKKNILASFLIRGCGIAISLILIPLTIHYVNPTRYGIWLTLSSIIGWFGFFDIGFGNGLRNKFAEALATDQKELARIYVSTTYATLIIIISGVLLLFLIANQFLDWTKILNTPPAMAKELSVLALIVFIFFCLRFVFQLITIVLTSDQKPAKASFFNLLGSIFSLLTIFILTKTTHGNLIYLGLALGATPVLVLATSSIWFYNHEYRFYAPSLKFVDFSYAKNLMTLGLKFFLLQIAALILYETSNIVIAQLFGPEQVTPYNVAYKYFGVITMVFNIVLTPLWSAYTEAYVKQEIPWIKNSVRKIGLVWLTLVVVAAAMLGFSRQAYTLWVGPRIKIPFILSAVLALYVIINAWCSIFSQFLSGVGKIKLQLYSGFSASMLNIPLAIFLGKRIGIEGVVLATCILGLTSAIWSPIQYYKIVNNKAKGIWAK